MSKETKSILLSCIFGLIFCFIVININYKEEDKSTKKETIEAEDIGIKEKKDTKKENVEKIEIDKKEDSASNKEKIKDTEKVKKEKKENTKPKVEKVKVENKEIKEESNLVSLGEFKLTAYCSCSKCCGKWAGSPTASGVMPKANHTIAVDTSVIPFGTKVMINGNTYVAEDTGSAIKGNKIDIYFDSHSKALNFGVRYAEVFVVK